MLITEYQWHSRIFSAQFPRGSTHITNRYARRRRNGSKPTISYETEQSSRLFNVCGSPNSWLGRIPTRHLTICGSSSTGRCGDSSWTISTTSSCAAPTTCGDARWSTWSCCVAGLTILAKRPTERSSTCARGSSNGRPPDLQPPGGVGNLQPLWGVGNLQPLWGVGNLQPPGGVKTICDDSRLEPPNGSTP